MKSYSVGFTGTKNGMNPKQAKEFIRLIKDIEMHQFHHGKCIGADAEAHGIISAFRKDCKIIIHPPINTVAEAKIYGNHEELPRKPYLSRNRDIVDACDVLIATPKEMEEVIRSGTWATVRYARKKKKPIIIIYPEEKKGLLS